MNDTQSSKVPQFLRSRIFLFGVGIIIVLLIVVSSIFLFSQSDPKPEFQPIPEEAIYSSDSITIKLHEEYIPAPKGQNPQWDSLYTKLQKMGVVGYERLSESSESVLRFHVTLQLREDASVEDIRKELYKLEEIKSAEPDYILTTQATVNDPYYPNMWHYPKIQMENAWNIETGSSDVKVAVIDTGIDYNHEDFVGRNIIRGKDFSSCNDTLEKYQSAGNNCTETKEHDNDPIDDNGHGTHVAGTIGAVSNNGLGIAGINHEVTLLAVKVLGRGGMVEGPDISKAIEYAVNQNAKIINMSFGGGGRCDAGSDIYDVINYARSKGVLLVVAAGNGDSKGVPMPVSKIMPANCPGVLVVGATGPNDERSSYSNYGPEVQIAAPGGVGNNWTLQNSISSLALNNGYKVTSGTSMSAPHVAGVAALLLAQNPSYTADQLKSCMISSGDSITTDLPIGNKRLNAYKALNSCADTIPNVSVTKSVTPSTTVSPSANIPTDQSYFIRGIVFDDKNKNFKKDTEEGTLMGVTVTLVGESKQESVVTGDDGLFAFNSLEPGKYRTKSSIRGTDVHEFRFSLTNQRSSYFLDVPVIFPVDAIPQTSPGKKPVLSGTLTPTQAPLFSCKERISNREVNNRTIQVKYLECTPK